MMMQLPHENLSWHKEGKEKIDRNLAGLKPKPKELKRQNLHIENKIYFFGNISSPNFVN
jgi:hypothetical protein